MDNLNATLEVLLAKLNELEPDLKFLVATAKEAHRKRAQEEQETAEEMEQFASFRKEIETFLRQHSHDTSPVGEVTLSAPLSGISMADLFCLIENLDLRVSDVIMHPGNYADLRKFGSDVLTLANAEEVLKTGVMAFLWGANIWANQKCSIGSIYAISADKGFDNAKWAKAVVLFD